MILRDKLYINPNEVSQHITQICNLFTYSNPEYYAKKKLKLSVYTTPRYIKHYDFSGNRIIIPRGGLQKLCKFLKANNIRLRVVDNRECGYPIDCFLRDTTLEKQQTDIIDILIKHEGGLIEAPPGAGKTIAMLGLITQLKVSTLILMHEHRLRTQWESEIQKRVGGNYVLGRLDGDKKEDGDIVTAIINSAYTKMQEDPSYFDKFGMVIVDEAHHVPANSYLTVLNHLPMKYRVGVTGTVERKDEKHFLLFDIFGEKLKSIKPSSIKNRITTFTFEIVNTNIPMELDITRRWTGKQREDVLDYTKFLGKLVEHRERNLLILNKAKELIELGYVPLILSSRIKHLKYLHEYLTSLEYNSILLIGENRKKVDWAEIQKDDTIQCICANDKIASEGLDYPRLSALILTCPTSNMPKLIQKIGRIRRVSENKKTPLVVDICDNLAYINANGQRKYLLRYSTKKRIELYQKLINEYSENM